MKKIIVEEEVIVTDGSPRESTGSNAIWAIAMIIIVAIIAAVVYYSGILKRAGGGGATQKINVSVPAR